MNAETGQNSKNRPRYPTSSDFMKFFFGKPAHLSDKLRSADLQQNAHWATKNAPRIVVVGKIAIEEVMNGQISWFDFYHSELTPKQKEASVQAWAQMHRQMNISAVPRGGLRRGDTAAGHTIVKDTRLDLVWDRVSFTTVATIASLATSFKNDELSMVSHRTDQLSKRDKFNILHSLQTFFAEQVDKDGHIGKELACIIDIFQELNAYVTGHQGRELYREFMKNRNEPHTEMYFDQSPEGILQITSRAIVEQVIEKHGFYHGSKENLAQSVTEKMFRPPFGSLRE